MSVISGLEAQLLGIVVRKERPELEEQKDTLVRSIANGKKKIQQLEDEILRLVSLAAVTMTTEYVQLVLALHESSFEDRVLVLMIRCELSSS